MNSAKEEKVLAARKKKAVDQFMAFLTTGLSAGRKDKDPKRSEYEMGVIHESLKSVSDDEILSAIAFYRDHPTLFDVVRDYARKFDCAGSLGADGLKEARNLLLVQEVMKL